ncbi:hypothetical protein [Streptomyces phaeoluteigriseus]|uniref:hypothetical protein n=1 Tax=Streptomyces phaeoluteigriseus TaxID=114686 RepID=UPI00368447EC
MTWNPWWRFEPWQARRKAIPSALRDPDPTSSAGPPGIRLRALAGQVNVAR